MQIVCYNKKEIKIKTKQIQGDFMGKRGYMQGACSDGTKLYFGHPYWSLLTPNDEDRRFVCTIWNKDGKKITPNGSSILSTITSLSNEQNGCLVANLDYKAYAYISLKDGRAYVFKGAWHIKDIAQGIGAVSYDGKYHFFDTGTGELDKVGYDSTHIINKNIRIVGDNNEWKVLLYGVSPSREMLELKNTTFKNYEEAYDRAMDFLSVANTKVIVGKGKIYEVPEGTFGKR